MSSVSVNPPKTPVTEGSSDKAIATLPNVCKMPGPPAPFVPTPLPNIGQSGHSLSDCTTTVLIEDKKVAIKGTHYMSRLSGDMASKGTGGGLVSSTTEGKTKFVAPGSMNVKAEGKNVQLLGDAMTNNGSNPDNTTTLPGNVQGAATPAFIEKIGDKDAADKLCDAACHAIDEKKKGSTKKNQELMAEKLSNGQFKPPGSPIPSYIPKFANILPEVPMLTALTFGSALLPLVSLTGRLLPGTAALAALSPGIAIFRGVASAARLLGGALTVADIVLLKNPAAGLVSSNISRFVEVKFPGDSLTRNQRISKLSMNDEDFAKSVEMHPDKDCVCA